MEMCKLKLVLSICTYKSPSVHRRRGFPIIGIIGYNHWWEQVPMTTANMPNDAEVTEHPKADPDLPHTRLPERGRSRPAG